MPERADADRDAREREQRHEPRLPLERRRQERRDDECAERPAHRLRVVVRGERRGEHARAERGEAEPREPVAPRAREEQERQPEARDRAGEPREADQRTTTVAVSTWPCSRTVSRYVPGERAARSFNTGADAKPERVPSVQRYRFASVETRMRKRASGFTVTRARGERDVAQRDGDPLHLGRTVAGEIDRADDERVRPRREQPPVHLAVPRDLVLRLVRAPADDALPVDEDEHVRVLAQLVVDRHRVRLVVAVGREHGTHRARIEHCGELRLEHDRVRDEDGAPLVREVHLHPVGPVRRERGRVRPAVPDERPATAPRQHAVGERVHLVAVRVEDRDRHPVGAAEADGRSPPSCGRAARRTRARPSCR